MTHAHDNQAVATDDLRIGDWDVRPALGELHRGERRVRLEPKAMALLVVLAARAGQVVSREALLAAVWRDVIVNDDTLTQAIIKLRKAFGDQARAAEYIQTIPKKGYRLIAPVAVLADNANTEREGRVATGPRSRRVLAVLAVGAGPLIALGAAWHLATRKASPGPGQSLIAAPAHRDERPTLSIVPFVPLGDSDDQRYLAQGLTLDLVTDLSKLSGLWLIGSRPILGQAPAETSQTRARYRVSGDAQRTDGNIRIHVRLFDAESNIQIWSERFNRPVGDLFSVQEQISRQIAEALSPKVTETERLRLARRYTRNVDAYQEFLRGQALLLVRTQAENARARSAYRRAISLDPTFARAYAGLALTYAADYRNQWVEDGAAALNKAREMSETALQLDPDIPEVYWVLAYLSAQQRRHEEALKLLARATVVDQSFADAYALMGGVNTYIGNPGASIGLLRTAIRLNRDAGYLYFLLLGRAYFFLGDWDQARINLKESLARNPANLEAHVYMAATEEGSGHCDAAAWEAEEVLALEPDYSTRSWLQTYPMVDNGQQGQLLKALAPLGL